METNILTLPPLLTLKLDLTAEQFWQMQEYQENGAKLGWLINRKQQQIEIYRLNQDVEILDYPNQISGEDILPGFVLDLTTIW
ncbi:hypothetical protein PCC9214_02227 [Planktothrix tepida]|uniref:Putative restriction endonuclease domain-containing protein n=1 Tax=Planktothrix tepida PCC 9214 TaxID=671072 RepID=A0A1J1LLJ8_9CYAN|nr:Uma2 family endonuclease [Planktothrix tepida]CAD5945744.1 hypothetical protein PCC9214_02227 [Planktothrix tepida]CUR32812.1 hypothetical protein PL9214500059 [Planktothrix tepida PCC 9214]